VYLSGFSILLFVIAIIRESMLIGQLATGAKNSLEKEKFKKIVFLL
jgi:hypothetical protein